jgi:hypothetical protein
MDYVKTRINQIVCIILMCVTTFVAMPSSVALASGYECKGNVATRCGDIIINKTEAGRAEAFAGGVIVGALGGSAATVGAVSGAGSVAGLSAAGISSGLAALGGTIGGGMAAGLVVSAAMPVTAAVGVGYTAYKVWDWVSNSGDKEGQNH